MINPSDFQNLEEAVETLERKDDLLLCSFSKEEEGSKTTDPLRPKFVELLSSSKSLRSIHFWRTIISKDLADALLQNVSIVEIILSGCPSDRLALGYYGATEQRMYLLKGLERKESLKTLMIIYDTVENEIADFIISSLRMRETLVELSCLVLETSKQFSAPYFRFERLQKLKVKGLMSESKGAIFLRGICFCKCLKQLEIENVSPLMLLIAFPKWNGELQELFPLTKGLYLDYPIPALLDRKLLGNVARRLDASNREMPSFFAAVFSKIVRNDTSTRFFKRTAGSIRQQARFTARVHFNKLLVDWRRRKGGSSILL